MFRCFRGIDFDRHLFGTRTVAFFETKFAWRNRGGQQAPCGEE
jgi:hypothetical protein